MTRELAAHPNAELAFKRISYGIIRDGATGKPRFDKDPSEYPPEMHMSMTRAERAEVGLWDGDYMRDAEGVKRIKLLDTGEFECVDTIRASSIISIDGHVTQVNERMDLEAGTRFNWAGGQ